MGEKKQKENDAACRECPEALTCESTDCEKRFGKHKPVPPIPQGPTNPIPVYPKTIKYTKLSDMEIENVGQILWCPEHKEAFTNNCSECMLANNNPDTIYKAKQEIISAYRPLLEQAERERDLAIKEMGEMAQRAGLAEGKIAALESQLKPANGWEETLIPQYAETLIYSYMNPDIIEALMKKLLKMQAELTWRKALASTEKGGTKC